MLTALFGCRRLTIDKPLLRAHAMTSPRRCTAEMTSLLAALGVSVLAGCGHPAESRSSGASAVQPPAASPARSAYDISRVERVKDDLPPASRARRNLRKP
ncbi:hypothetical protein I553_1277 [Mycobacterium xenopi 4042]|uniref:Uncharacterized protein n=1 Tax=Mycobacterium xenopi 4042 TaxID=1299334 RepID=X8CHU0_MYCXE|nr:hypothetical protein I553_1277 [Mycobacterium xenopi 4042]